LVQEIPLLVVRSSADGYRVKREYEIETDPKSSNKDLILWKDLRDDNNINIVKDGNGGYWVNNVNYEGQTIDQKLLDGYEKAILGDSSFCGNQNDSFFNAANVICDVTLESNSNNTQIWCGSCKDFYKRTTCVHALAIKDPDQLEIRLEPIKQKKNAGV
jgi:hypothetical protein